MRSLANDFYNLYLSVLFEQTKHLKRKRILIVGALAILVPLLFYIDPVDTAEGFASTSLRFLNLLIIIAGAMLAGDAISGEFEKKTGLLVFPTPQRRISIFAGKYVAALIAALSVVCLYYLVLTVQIIHLFGMAEIPGELWKSFLVAVFYASSAVSVIYFFSSIFKTTITSSLVGFFLLMMILPIVSVILTGLDIEPWFVVTYSANLITDVLGDASGGGFGPQAHLAKESFAPSFNSGVLVMIVYAIGFFLVSTGIANRKSME
jgi:ABC-type transport system involved in multi-copper enzyme maturation permease subunit